MPKRPSKQGNGNTKSAPAKSNGNGANLGFEAQMFLAADKLRKNLEPSDYKHVALGLIFLKHISNAFEAKRAALLAEDTGLSPTRDEPGRLWRAVGSHSGPTAAMSRRERSRPRLRVPRPSIRPVPAPGTL